MDCDGTQSLPSMLRQAQHKLNSGTGLRCFDILRQAQDRSSAYTELRTSAQHKLSSGTFFSLSGGWACRTPAFPQTYFVLSKRCIISSNECKPWSKRCKYLPNWCKFQSNQCKCFSNGCKSWSNRCKYLSNWCKFSSTLRQELSNRFKLSST